MKGVPSSPGARLPCARSAAARIVSSVQALHESRCAATVECQSAGISPATNATTVLSSRHPLVATPERYDDSSAPAKVGVAGWRRMSTLVRAFEQEAGAAARGRADGHGAALAELLSTLYKRGRAAHPRLAVPEAAFGRTLAHCAADGDTKSLADLAIEDVYLACACAERVSGAEAVFDRRFRRVIRRAVSRVLASADERQEAE